MRLRFTIRDLLWLAALVAVCMAWWLDHRVLWEAHQFDQINNQGLEADNAHIKAINELLIKNAKELDIYRGGFKAGPFIDRGRSIPGYQSPKVEEMPIVPPISKQ